MSTSFDFTIDGDANDNVLVFPNETLDVRIRGRGGNDTIQGGSGNDTLLGQGGSDRVLAGRGNDHFIGGGGRDIYDASQLFTTFGATTAFVFGFGGVIDKGGLGIDRIGTFDPDDFSTVEPIEVVIAPVGADDNRIDLSPQNPSQNERAFARVDLKAGTVAVLLQATGAELFTVEVQNFDDITGTRFADTLRGDNQANIILGRGGNDKIAGRGGADDLRGGGGNDTIKGGGGNDELRGGGGNDTLDGGGGNDALRGNAGNDRLVGSSGSDNFIGGSGDDIADYSQLNAAISFNQGGRIVKGGGALGTDQLGLFDPFEAVEAVVGDADERNTIDTSGGSNISIAVDLTDGGPVLNAGRVTATVEAPFQIGGQSFPAGLSFTTEVQNFTDIVGTDTFADDLRGDSQGQTIRGLGGNDDIRGRGGDDTLVGGAGADDIRPGGGADRVVLTDLNAADRVFGFSATADSVLVAIAGVANVKDVVNGGNLELRVQGGAFNNTLLATLVGSASDDSNIDIDIGPFVA